MAYRKQMKPRGKKRIPINEVPINDPVSRGGYDYAFVEEPPHKFFCNICAKVLRDPYLTECCGQHYCESCIKHWIQENRGKVCPHCRKNDFIHILNKALKREINELKVHCINQEKGCEWENELENLETHLKDCGYVEVECSNKCNHRLMRNELSKHLRNECLLREYTCKHCHRVDTYHAITGDCPPNEIHCPAHPGHYDSCPELKLVCSKCGEGNIKRKDMTEHQAQCPKEPVECPFEEAGCNVKPLRSELDEHTTQNTQKHLELVMGAFQILKGECNGYKKRLECLENQAMARQTSTTSREYITATFQPQQEYPFAYATSIPATLGELQYDYPRCIFQVSVPFESVSVPLARVHGSHHGYAYTDPLEIIQPGP